MKFQKGRLAQLSDKLILEIAFWTDFCKQILEEREKDEGITLKLHYRKNRVCVKQPESQKVL